MNPAESFIIPENEIPDRADRIIVRCLEGSLTRSSVARLIRQQRILVGGKPIRPSSVLNPGDTVLIVSGETEHVPPQGEPLPEICVLLEDDHVVVVDKPPGLVVHPGAGRPAGTMMDILVAQRPEMIGVGEPGRWGIVHRLDRDTSGVMVVAKSVPAHASLSVQFRTHSVHRVYLALVRGSPRAEEGTIDAPLGRHSGNRKKISTVAVKYREAKTRWRVIERFRSIALLEVKPETGRTHQIRVHLASVGLPILGDQVYGRQCRQPRPTDRIMRRAFEIMKRQALHAAALGFRHPSDGRYMEHSSPLPSDMRAVLNLFG